MQSPAKSRLRAGCNGLSRCAARSRGSTRCEMRSWFRIEAEAEAAFHDRRLRFDGNGNLSKISVAGLASFLGLSDAAGGTLNSGHFTFHGTPGDFAKSEATMRLEVGAFQWESRQWDSLV